MDFVHLHNHTEYSLLDGAARISKLVKTAREYGMPAVAITDHGNMYGTYKFYKECKKHNIKAIIGCEVYIVDDMLAQFPKEHRGHLVLLAKDNQGYQNLCKINSAAWTKGFYYKPRVDYNFLKTHSKGLICLSACLAGHIPYNLMQGMYDEAVRYATTLKEIFAEDFYIELQDHGMQEQQETNPKLIQIAKQLDAQLVCTNDVHYIFAEDAEMQDALMCVEMRRTVDDPERMKFPTDQFYFKTSDEMRKLFPKEACDNTVKIAEKCNCHPFERADLIPEFKSPNGQDNVTYFRTMIEKGLQAKYGKITPAIRERYETEFKIIHENKFVDYFLIVADFMNFANEKGIAVGPGRGSGAGSIIAYALNITRVDPLKYNLLFERFLHSERVSMPDFDLDFCCNRREEVIDYVIQKYGADKVCQIVTFGTLAAKAAIKDIARVFKMPYAEVEAVTKPININQGTKPPVLPYVFGLKKLKNPQNEPDFNSKDEKTKETLLTEYKKEKEKLDTLKTPELINLYQNNSEIKKIVDMALKVEGFPRNCSTHAAGVIICKKVVGNVTPLQRNGEDITSQFDMKEIEQLGMLKMDFLGLITLTDIQGALADIKNQLGKDIDFYAMEYNDPEVYKMISSGNTDAVFQLESGGFKRFMKDLRPDTFEDIIAGVALFRPGPMDMIPDYCRNKHNPSLTKYEHPLLEPILKNTYGQIVYQEQVMDIFKYMGGYTLGQADMVRRAMGKKDVKEMDRQREIFIKGAAANKVPVETAKSIFEKMAKFAGYAFNKSHATCYAFLAYQTAYLKYYYYPYYMASVLNNRIHKWDDMTHYIISIRANGIPILAPSINQSQVYFKVENGNSIRFGLAALKNVGVGLIESILQERTNNGPFKSFHDFCKRVDFAALNKRVIESLILSGAFDEFKIARSQLMAIHPIIHRIIWDERKAAENGQLSMFNMLDTEESVNVQIPNIPEYDSFTKGQNEREVVGVYLSGHPLEQYTAQIADCNFNTGLIKKNTNEQDEAEITTDDEESDNQTVQQNLQITLGAIITDIKKVVTKTTKQEMAILKVEDMYGSCEVMVFPKTLEKSRSILQKNAIIKIKGRISIREGEDPIILAENFELLDNSNKDQTTEDTKTTQKLYLKYNTKDPYLHDEVLKVLEVYSGDIPVIIKCTATNQAASPKFKIRNCDAIIFELVNLLEKQNVILK